jgi:hypothetical protein
LVNRISKEDYTIILGVDVPVKTLKQKIKLQFLIYHSDFLKRVLNWEDFVSENIRGSKGIVLMYDIANEAPILLVGNNADLKEIRGVSKGQMHQFKKINELSSSIEISLKTGENVEKAFINLTEMMIRKNSTDYKVEIKKITFLKEHKRLAFLLFISILGAVFLLSWFMFYLIYVAE